MPLILLLLLAAAAPLCAEDAALEELNRRAQAAEDLRFSRTLELADVCDRMGRLDEARRCYEQALALRPRDADAAASLLSVLRRLGDFEAQWPLYERLTAQRAADYQLHLDAAECLWRLTRTDEARRAWDDLLNRFADNRFIYDGLIDFFIGERMTEDARRVIGLRRERFGEDTWLLMAEVRLAIAEGKTDDALTRLQALLERDLSEEESRRAETLLFQLAHRSGRAEDVAGELAAQLDTLDARVAGRLLTLAEDAAKEKRWADAAAFADRALDLLKDPVQRAQTAAKAATWKALASK
jgi:tetratricopeptide (TPR) repeat protein